LQNNIGITEDYVKCNLNQRRKRDVVRGVGLNSNNPDFVKSFANSLYSYS
jgi:hypothetical protein